MGWLKLLLDFLKFGAIAAGSISGLIGTLTETKDKKSGNPTPWGKRIVFLIVISGIIAVSIQSIETYLRQQSDAQDAKARLEAADKTSMILDKANQAASGIQQTISQQNALLQNLRENVEKTDSLRKQAEKFGTELKNQRESIAKTVTGIEQTARGLNSILLEQYRVMQPIDSVSVFVANIEVPMDQPPLNTYKTRLNKGIDEFLAESPQSNRPGLSIPAFKVVNGIDIPTRVEVAASHPLFPQHVRESLSNSILSISNMDLAFYKKPISPATFRPFTHGILDDPDLRVELHKREGLNLVKNLEEGASPFYLAGSFELSERRTWDNKSSAIIAIPDLAGAQLFISFGPLGVGGDNKTFLNVRQKFSLKTLKIEFGNRGLWINSSDLQRHVSDNGAVFWEFRFPANKETLFTARPQ